MDKNTNKAGFLNERNSFEGLCNKMKEGQCILLLGLITWILKNIQ